MLLTALSLTNFRNFATLEFLPEPGLLIFQAENAQGKTNLLEAIYLLATSRSPRTSNEREVIHWRVAQEDYPACRVAGEARRGTETFELEVALRCERAPGMGGAAWAEDPENPAHLVRVQKRIRINQVPRRASELLGVLKLVLFLPQDVDLVAGEPGLRRRFLDLANAQVNPAYLRSLQEYQRVLLQRNHLLRQIGQGEAQVGELAFWDQRLTQRGAYLVMERRLLMGRLAPGVRSLFRELSEGEDDLSLHYLSSVPSETLPEERSQAQAELEERLRGALEKGRPQEIAQGMTLVGPHRDDLRFTLGGADLHLYGSRGQQRLLALCLRLAEGRFLEETGGTPPILLLDDVLSELDLRRRKRLWEALPQGDQIWLTTTDLSFVEPRLLRQASLYRLAEGELSPLAAGALPFS